MGAGRRKVSDDEKAIRAFVQDWFAASRSGDIDAIIALMEEDAVFMSPGAEPFGRDAFKAMAAQMKHMQLDMQSDILEIKILGDWAFFRSRLQVGVTPPGGKTLRRAGQTLTILRKGDDGAWRLARDANMLV
jgi:uncharacterized protein (TIGR02246 family)